MKRFLALVLIAFTFALAQVVPVSHAVASPVGDPGAGKPEAAMDSAMKDSKDTADADKKTPAKTSKKSGKHHSKSHKKSAKKDTAASDTSSK